MILELPFLLKRDSKTRDNGLTMVIDKGLGFI